MAGSPSVGAHSQHDDCPLPSRPLAPVQLLRLTSLNLAYGFMLADQGILLAPLEAEQLFPHRASLGLGTMAISCGFAQLVGPAAGRWSDQYQSVWGRRRPGILLSMTLIVLSTAALWMLSVHGLPTLFLIFFLMQQCAWNVLLSIQAGLVPDLVPQKQRGAAGGAGAANVLCGALLALLTVRFTSKFDFHLHYLFTAGLGIFFSCNVCLAANEQSSIRTTTQTHNKLGLFRQVKECYVLDLHRHREFSILLLSKALYCASVMVKGFLLFFIQDTFLLNDASVEQTLVANSAIAGETAAAISAIFATLMLGVQAHDQVSNLKSKPYEVEEAGKCPSSCVRNSPECDPVLPSGIVPARRAGLFGAFWMGLFWFGPLLVGLCVLRERGTTGTHQEDKAVAAKGWSPYMIVGTAVWGIGQGIYLAGDQALNYMLLPDPDQAARLLGLTSVCACIGAVFGGAAFGMLLFTFGAHDAAASPWRPGYSFEGYAAMFSLAVCLSWCCGFALRSIQPKQCYTFASTMQPPR